MRTLPLFLHHFQTVDLLLLEWISARNGVLLDWSYYRVVKARDRTSFGQDLRLRFMNPTVLLALAGGGGYSRVLSRTEVDTQVITGFDGLPM